MAEHQLSEVIEQVDDITQTVWATLFDAPMVARSPDDPALPRAARSITACVQITGPHDAVVTVMCATELGRKVAAKFFDVPEADATLDEVRDAMGEIANMVGGNLKGLLPGPSRLSLPAVTEGADYTTDIRGTKELRAFAYVAEGAIFKVTVFERLETRHSIPAARPSQHA
jgi:chemotaxis protein CheX